MAKSSHPKVVQTELAALVLDLASVSKCLRRSELSQTFKLCEVGKEYLKTEAISFVQGVGLRPLLESYGNDGTPLLTKERHVVFSGGKRIVRCGGAGGRILCRKTFLAL